MINYKKVTGTFDLTGQGAIVVGGAGGIGEATAEMYARKGAKVAIVDCKDTCGEIADRIAKEFGVQTIGVKCDVTDQKREKLPYWLPCPDSLIFIALPISRSAPLKST